MDRSRVILEARDVGRRGSTAASWILRDISLQVHAGQRLVVVGPSGSGKTLLLRALAMLDPLDAGEVRWQGQPVANERVPTVRREVVYLHQRPALGEGSVEDSLRQPYGFAIHRDRRFDPELIRHWLIVLGRESTFLQKSTRDLSGGEAQVTALMRAMQLEPQVLLLDEPTAALDHAATEAVEQLVRQWQAEQPERRAAVLVSHDREQAERMAERVIRMQAGQLVEES